MTKNMADNILSRNKTNGGNSNESNIDKKSKTVATCKGLPIIGDDVFMACHIFYV